MLEISLSILCHQQMMTVLSDRSPRQCHKSLSGVEVDPIYWALRYTWLLRYLIA